MDREALVKAVERYFQLSEDEAVDLADQLDYLYNDIKSKYLEALWNPSEKKELADAIIKKAIELLKLENLDIEKELELIALLDILSTDLYDKFLLYKESGKG
ncbi:hypothetical protein ACSU1N_06595 [Thermogladius sp. 4427co]|uniref:hypothetical protein n=1 Tax=Thermogladius sp. 4427co TaxID=3450718 RepID=UPI003F7A6798